MSAAALPSGFDVTIYHNPACSNSRQALAAIREAGIEPRVVEYLKTPYTRGQLKALLAAAGLGARELLRSKEAAYQALDLGSPRWSDDELIDHMVAQPVLVNRPIVVTPLGTRLCRPGDTVREILPG